MLSSNTMSSSSKVIHVELSDLLFQCLQTECADPVEWATNAVQNRARIAYEKLIQAEIERRFKAGEPILSDKDANLVDAFARGLIPPATPSDNQVPPPHPTSSA